MKEKKLWDWCQKATEQIRYKPDRKAVAAELMAHMEDAYEAQLADGYTPAEATQKTLEAMGSAEEIAPQLAKLHKPWLGYAYSLVKVCAILVLTFSLFLCAANGVSFVHNWLSAKNFDSLPANYGALDFYAHPGVHDSTDGLYFEVVEAGYSKSKNEFYFQLDVIHLPIMRHTSVTTLIWAIDSNGNYYPCRAEAQYQDIPKVTYGGLSSTGLITHNLMLILDFDCSAQWVELHYDRDGRDLVLRIDLTGGEKG